MKFKIIFILFLIGLLFSGCIKNKINSFDDNKEKIIYRFDNKFFRTVGITADRGHIIVSTFLSYEVHFESKIDSYEERWLETLTHELLSIPVRHYFNDIFTPMFTLKEFIEIVIDKQNTFFLDGFSEYIKDNEDLSNIKIIGSRMKMVEEKYFRKLLFN